MHTAGSFNLIMIFIFSRLHACRKTSHAAHIAYVIIILNSNKHCNISPKNSQKSHSESKEHGKRVCEKHRLSHTLIGIIYILLYGLSHPALPLANLLISMAVHDSQLLGTSLANLLISMTAPGHQ
ncbi:MAG: hypothetical protein II627_09285, partial [Lachnospiraceae bacterium]|nr:hypothetical protein [Lachnospiraceae bacterium]